MQAVAARLEALENDIVAQDTGAGDSDDEEFILRDDGSDEGAIIPPVSRHFASLYLFFTPRRLHHESTAYSHIVY